MNHPIYNKFCFSVMKIKKNKQNSNIFLKLFQSLNTFDNDNNTNYENFKLLLI